MVKVTFGDFHRIQLGDGIGQIVDIRAASSGTRCDAPRGFFKIRAACKVSVIPINNKRVAPDGLI